MRKRIAIVLVIFTIVTAAASACDFKFNVGNNIKSCRSGEVIELTIELSLTHRVCNVAAAQTKFKLDGVKAVGATPWKQLSPTKYVRTVKLQVLQDNKNRISLTATRTCDKEGGIGTFVLPKQN